MRRRTNAQQRIDNFLKSFKSRHNKPKKKKKKRYPRDESIYNLCQENEFPLFLEWMPVSAMYVSMKHDNYCGRGRPPYYSLYDILVCICIQRYFHLSLRRSMGVIKFIVKKAKLHVKVPCFKMLNIHMNDSTMKTYVDEIIELTSSPTRLIEQIFTTDTTGSSTFCFTTWFMLRMKRKVKKRDHITAHVSSGTKTNIVTALDVDCNKGKDGIYFRKHVDRTVRSFKPKEWSGDGSYASRENCNKCDEYGIKPYFKLKENVTDRAKNSPAWRRMVREGRENKEKYDNHYHKRSNSESTNSAKTRKFHGFVRSKNDWAKENEESFGWVCYNFTALARAYYQYPDLIDFDW